MNLDLLQENREQIIKIASKHGVYNVRIFGSVARGEILHQTSKPPRNKFHGL